jgi:hypothetical protein
MTIDGVERASARGLVIRRGRCEPLLDDWTSDHQRRGVDDSDRAGSPPVAIVSESFARRIADGGSAIGRSLGSLYQGPSMTLFTRRSSASCRI